MVARTRRADVLLAKQSPIVRSIVKVFGGRLAERTVVKGTGPTATAQRSNRRGAKPRTDIVDEKLCDDVIKYLAPTLEPYKGCTILDVHPGACLWSRKLHDFLQPKRHVLMEPEERYVKTFIQPLLETPGTTYRHTPMTGAHPKSYWENYRNLLSDGQLIPPRQNLEPDDPKRLELDTSFLVTGNLARRYSSYVQAKTVPYTQLILQHMTWAALANEIFHGHGRVRMLWWLPEQYKYLVFPSVLNHRTSYMVGLRMGADISEVVGVKPLAQYFKNSRTERLIRQRSTDLLSEDVKQVRQRMQHGNMHVPQRRKIHRSVQFTEDKSLTTKSPTAITLESITQLREALSALEARWNEIMEAMHVSFRAGKSDKAERQIPPLLDTIEYPQCHEALHGITMAQKLSQRPFMQPRMALCMDARLQLINLEAHLCQFAEQGTDVNELKNDMVKLDASMKQFILDVSAQMAIEIDNLVEDQHAFFAHPQVLTSDRRSYEPLQADVKDFWPHTELSLLDMSPTSRDLSVPGIADTKEAITTCQELLKYLFLYRSHPLPRVLDHIAPNAAKDLVPTVPSITDARRGGRLNPNNIKVRMLSEEMIEGLLKAWFEWPFRPMSWELAVATSGEYSEEGPKEEVSLEGVPGFGH